MSVNGRVGSVGRSTGVCVKAFLRLAKAVSWASVHLNGVSFCRRSVRAETLVEKLAMNHW